MPLPARASGLRVTAWVVFGSVLAVVALLASPVVPVAFLVWAYWQRRHARRALPGWLNEPLGYLTRRGRAVLLFFAFVGAELVAIEFLASEHNQVDEHMPSVVGVFVFAFLVLVAACDFAVQGTRLGVRDLSRRLRSSR